jgi:hypothetical protein
MPTLANALIQVELDDRWPRITSMQRLESRAQLAGCPPEQPFQMELNGVLVKASEITCTVKVQDQQVNYWLEISALKLSLCFRFALHNEEIHWTMPQVQERGDFTLETLYLPEHRLVSGLGKNGDFCLRLSSWRINFSAGWLSGGEAMDYGSERLGRVMDFSPEHGPAPAQHACIWNLGVCAALRTSIWAAPLVTSLDTFNAPVNGRAGRFSIWADAYYYRLRGELAEPLQVTIALLGDYDGNGQVDWCDAANWEGDQRMPGEDPYREVMVYKLCLDWKKLEQPNRTFAGCLDIIRCLHRISGGLKQIVYLVGWQHEGHDTGFPNPQFVNPRLGGKEALQALVAEARQYNCVVSVHANLDDAYENSPNYDARLTARGPDGQPVLWFYNSSIEQNCYSVNHTLSLESGAAQQWIDNLLKLTGAQESLHLDAYRPTSETYLPDGTLIPMESEYQHGLAAINRCFRAQGVDITSEGPLYNLNRWTWILPDWRHHYLTVMSHSRMGGFYRITGGYHRNRDHAGDALGCGYVWDEVADLDEQSAVRRFYTDWMYDQILRRKRMTGYQVGDWLGSASAQYTDHTLVRSGWNRDELYAEYEGLPVARGPNRFLPWRAGVIFAYSPQGGQQSWRLPEAWQGQAVRAVILEHDGRETDLFFTLSEGEIQFEAPPGKACKLTLKTF